MAMLRLKKPVGHPAIAGAQIQDHVECPIRFTFYFEADKNVALKNNDSFCRE